MKGSIICFLPLWSAGYLEDRGLTYDLYTFSLFGQT